MPNDAPTQLFANALRGQYPIPRNDETATDYRKRVLVHTHKIRRIAACMTHSDPYFDIAEFWLQCTPWIEE